MERKNETAIVLGGTTPHIELISNLKKRGYYVVLLDYLSNSPCINVADEHIRESTLNIDKVTEIARERNAKLVISTCIDQANSTCCYVAEKLGLPRPYSYETSLDVTNKGRMKKIFKDAGIATSKYFTAQAVEEIDWEKVNYPAVVKPVDCNSSKGVHRVNDEQSAKHYFAEALSLSRTHTAIIEDFNEGVEIQVDCFALTEGVKVIMTRQKKKIKEDSTNVLQSSGSIIPGLTHEKLKLQAEKIAEKIASAFGLHNTPFFFQGIVTGDEIKVLEFAPRIGGGLSYYLIKMVTGFDILNASIDSFLGIPVSVSIVEPSKWYSTNLLYMKSGVFDHIDGVLELKKDGIIKDFFQLKNEGTVINAGRHSGNRVAAFVIEADNAEVLEAKSIQAYERLEILDNNGNKMLDRDVY